MAPAWTNKASVRWAQYLCNDAQIALGDIRDELRYCRRHGLARLPDVEAKYLFCLDWVWAMQEFVKTMEARV